MKVIQLDPIQSKCRYTMKRYCIRRYINTFFCVLIIDIFITASKKYRQTNESSICKIFSSTKWSTKRRLILTGGRSFKSYSIFRFEICLPVCLKHLVFAFFFISKQKIMTIFFYIDFRCWCELDSAMIKLTQY